MKRKKITISEAEEAWESMKNNEFMIIHYPNFSDYWKECQRINNLEDGEWHKLIEENTQKLRDWKKNNYMSAGNSKPSYTGSDGNY